MNKRLILVFSLLLILAAGVFAYLQMSNSSVEIQNLTDLLPQRALVYASVHNLDKAWSRIKLSDLYSKIINSPLITDNQELDSLKEKANLKWLGEKEILAILGKDAVLGVFFRKIVSDQPEFDVILASRIDKTTKVKEVILSSFSKVGKDCSITSQKYKGFRINSVKHKSLKEDLVYLILGDVLVLGNSPKLLKESIDLIKNEYEGSISKESDFIRARGKLSSDHFCWIYSKIDGFQELTAILTKNEDYKFNAEFNPVNSYFAQIILDNGFYFIAQAYVDLEEKEEDISLMKHWRQWFESINNTQARVLEFTPLDVAMVSVGNAGDIKLAWEYLKEMKSYVENNISDATDDLGEGNINNRIGQFPVDLTSILGFDFAKDVLPYLGEEYGFSFVGFKPIDIPLAVIQSQAEPLSLSFPEMFACIQITDKSNIENVIGGLWQRMADGINSQVESMSAESVKVSKAQYYEGEDKKTVISQEEDAPSSVIEDQASPKAVSIEASNFSGIDIYSLKLLSGTPFSLWISEDVLSPSYYFLGDYLAISTNKPLAQQTINAYQGKLLSLDESVRFSRVYNNLQGEFYTLIYLNPKEYIDPIISMFASTLKYGTDDFGHEKRKQDFQKFVQLGDIIKNIKSIGSTAIKKDDFMEFEFYIPIEGL